MKIPAGISCDVKESGIDNTTLLFKVLFAPVQGGTAGAVREEVGKAGTGKKSAAKSDLFHIHAGLLQIVTGKLKALI